MNMADPTDSTTETVDETEQADADRDALTKMLGELDTHIRRMQKAPPATVAALSQHVAGTVMEFIKDVVQKHLDMYDYVTEMDQDFEDRLIVLEASGGPEGISEEDAGKLREYVEFANKMMDTLIPTLEGEVKAETERMRALGTECTAIVESLAGEGDEDEDEPEDEADDSAGGTN